METLEAIKETLKGILNRTIQQKIDWTFINQNAIKWTKVDKKGPTVVLLQRQFPMDPNMNTIFLISIQPPPSPSPQLTPNQKERVKKETTPIQFNSNDHPELLELLVNIFEAAQVKADMEEEERKANIIKGLLDGI